VEQVKRASGSASSNKTITVKKIAITTLPEFHFFDENSEEIKM
jgi:hypothetical protein